MISTQITDHRSQIQNLQVQIPDLHDSKSPCPTYYVTQTHRINYSKYSTAYSPGRIPGRHSYASLL